MKLVYTDGSCLGNPGQGGWAYRVLNSSLIVLEEVSGSEPTTTNNAMELRAVLEFFRREEKSSYSRTLIHSDSSYLVQGISKWIYSWVKRRWTNSSGHTIANRDLWQELYEVTRGRDLVFKWVKAHGTDINNNFVDNQARLRAKQQDGVIIHRSILDDREVPS